MARPVYFLALDEANPFEAQSVCRGLARMCAAAGFQAPSNSRTWALKVEVGEPGRPSAVAPVWAETVAEQLGRTGAFVFDTLSITKAELADVGRHLQLAAAKGFNTAGRDGGEGFLPYFVADDPAHGAAVGVESKLGGVSTRIGLGGRLGGVDSLCVLTPVRPHPHLGMRGALANLGVGLGDRESKLALHRDIRPRVDTPLCAGCGGCLTVCLFDAIVLRAGRATIDHERCTGCGECMNVCFMAGIAADDAAGIERFQVKMAEAAGAIRERVCGAERERQLYLNILVRLDRGMGGAKARQRDRLGDVGILAGSDPVAVDQATVDLIAKRSVGGLSGWSGFMQTPERLLARAVELGLGQREYRLLNI